MLYEVITFSARLVWLHDQPLQPGRSYLLKAGATTAPARVERLAHTVNVNTLQQEDGTGLALNEIGLAELRIDRSLSFDAYRDNRASGSFILIDRMSNATVGAGMIEAPLVQASDHDAGRGEDAAVITSYSIHYTKLYEPASPGR